MKTVEKTAEATINLRVRVQDRALIDQAATLSGSSRSQFMLSSALREAKNVILDRTSFFVDGRTFNQILDMMDAPATQDELTGMKRLLEAKKPWADG